MAILNGITIKGSEEVHQLDYEKAIANKPTLVKSFNDLEDKPFEANVNEVDILTKGDYEFTKEESDNLYSYYHTFDLETNSDYIIEWDGVTYNLSSVSVVIEDEGATLLCLGNASLMGLGENTGEPFLVVDADELKLTITASTATSHNIKIYQSKEEIKYLDAKFIKDMYSSETKQNIIFEKQNVQFVEMSDGGTSGNGYVHIPSLDIDGSKNVFVEWDGTLYRCTPSVDSDTETSREIYVGNLAVLGGEDTGEPFMIVDSLQATVFASVDKATHVVCVYQIDEVVHQIEPKYVNAYTKEEINEMLGIYIDEVNTLLGGED